MDNDFPNLVTLKSRNSEKKVYSKSHYSKSSVDVSDVILIRQ